MLIHGAIEAAVEEERCAIAYQLGLMRGESESAAERAAYDKVAAMLHTQQSTSP